MVQDMDGILRLSSFLMEAFSLSATNLFQDDWVRGNLYEIADITNILGPAACWIISLVGFMIVIISISKNALSGLYCVWPDFWDKVDEVQTQIADGVNSSFAALGSATPRGGAAVTKIGSFLSFLIGHFPNVKALTDFNGVETSLVDKKQYFMRSLPLMVAQIFIGMFIFFGKPADVANFIGQAGIKGVDIVLANIDPIETVKHLSDKFADLQLATDDSKVPFDKVVNGVTRDIVSSISSQHSDLKKNTRQEVAGTVEGIIQNKFAPHSDIIGAEQGWNVSYKAAYNTTQPANPTGSGWNDAGNGVYINKSSSGIMAYRTFIPVSQVNTGKQIDPVDNVMVTITCVPEAVDVTKYKDVRIYAKLVRTKGNAIQLELPKDMEYSENPGTGAWGISGVNARTVAIKIAKPVGSNLEEVAAGSGRIEASGNTVTIYDIDFGKSGLNGLDSNIVYKIKVNGWKMTVNDQTSNYSMSIATFLASSSINSGVKVGSNGKVIGDSSSLLSALKTGTTSGSGSGKATNIPEANGSIKDTSPSGTNTVKPVDSDRGGKDGTGGTGGPDNRGGRGGRSGNGGAGGRGGTTGKRGK
jgi:hypothetical protein